MIGLDTNVLARHFLQDEPTQALEASRLISRLTPEKPGFIATVVLCELIWVLRGTYKIAKMDCVTVVDQILSAADLRVENAELCRRALKRYAEGNADFSDFVIREIALSFGCSTIVTFDRKALKVDGFTSPD